MTFRYAEGAAKCPHCGDAVFRKSSGGDKLKARTTILVVHSNGTCEINCGSCKKGIVLPLTVDKDAPFDLKKASGQRFVIREPS